MLDKIRVLIADSHYLARQGLKALLEGEPGFQVVGEAATREELLAMVPKMEPKVVLLDYRPDGGFQVEDVHAVRHLGPQANVLILAHFPDRQQVYQLLESGAKSFLLQECDRDEIISALRACAKGDKFFCDRILDVLIEPLDTQAARPSTARASSSAMPVLTQREKEILYHIGQGKTTQQIAETLMLSTHTVHTHRKNIMRKTGVHKTADLIRYAMSHTTAG